MAQTTAALKQDQDLNKPRFPDSLPIEITRIFHAPIDLVWKAWSSPDMIKQWWGPEGFSCPEAKIDFRAGGKYNFAMLGPDHKTNWSGGEIKEIVPYEKIVYTDRFTDQDGKPVDPSVYGMPGDWPKENFVTVTFEEFGDNETRMTLLHEGIPKQLHDDCVQGWESSLDKFQKLVERS